MPALAAKVQVHVDQKGCIPHALHVALLVEVEIGAADREPSVGGFAIGRRHVQGKVWIEPAGS